MANHPRYLQHIGRAPSESRNQPQQAATSVLQKSAEPLTDTDGLSLPIAGILLAVGAFILGLLAAGTANFVWIATGHGDQEDLAALFIMVLILGPLWLTALLAALRSVETFGANQLPATAYVETIGYGIAGALILWVVTALASVDLGVSLSVALLLVAILGGARLVSRRSAH